jgi:hypothetical protein
MGIPESTTTDTPESTQQVDYEKRFKDTQAFATKVAQEKAEAIRELQELKAELSVLKETAKPSLTIDAQTQSELEDLKYSDPDAWRAKVNELEQNANLEFNSKIDEAKKLSTQQLELQRRANILEQFQTEHPDVVFTDELLNLDIPRRIVKELEEGKVTYEEFLNNVYNYVKTPKVIGSTTKTLEQPNLSKTGGDDTPTKNSSSNQNIIQSYENMEF